MPSRIGSEVNIQSNADTGNQNIVVPTGTELVLLFASGYVANANWMTAASMTLGGAGMTLREHTSDDTNENVGVWYLSSPTTGASVAFEWDWNRGATINEGVNFIFVFIEDVGATPIRDSGKNSSTPSNPDVTGMTANTGDLMVGATCAYAATPTVTDDGQTQVYAASRYNGNELRVAEELSEGDYYCTPEIGDYDTSVAVVVAAAAGGGAEAETTFYMRHRIEWGSVGLANAAGLQGVIEI